MKLSLALPLLAVGAMAAPTLVGRGNSDPAALRLAEKLPAVKAKTASGQEITLIQLEDGVYDPATGQWVGKNQVVQSAIDNGDANAVAQSQEQPHEKRIIFTALALLCSAFSGRNFGGHQINDVTNIYNQYGSWGNGPWDVQSSDWCSACVAYSGHRGGYGVFDTDSRTRVYGPQDGYWGQQ